MDWVKNIVAAGRCSLRTRGRDVELVEPELIADPELAPSFVRLVEKRLAGVTEVLRMREPSVASAVASLDGDTVHMRGRLRIRPATADDAATITRVFLDSKATLTFLPNLHSDEETFGFIANVVLRDQEVLVADHDGEITGFIAMHEGMVEHLYVRSDLLRQGIGGALLSRAKERMPSGFRLWVFRQNVPARRFYERHGLRLIDETDGSRNEERTPDALYGWAPRPP